MKEIAILWMYFFSVSIKTSFLGKLTITNTALVWLLSGVHTHVNLQIMLNLKSFATHLASKGLLSSMGTDMVLKTEQ